jgi:hypothetical protein
VFGCDPLQVHVRARCEVRSDQGVVNLTVLWQLAEEGRQFFFVKLNYGLSGVDTRATCDYLKMVLKSGYDAGVLPVVGNWFNLPDFDIF